MKEPQTLQKAIEFFSDPDRCIDYLALRRWPDGKPVCPTCGRTDAKYLENQKRWQCKSVHPKRQFSIKVGTIFEDSPIGLDKWLTVLWMLVNCKNGVSSYEIHRAIGVTQKSAWFMLHRLREILAPEDREKLGGPEHGGFESDETYVGGKAKNMHKSKKLRIMKTRNEIPDWKHVATNPGSLPGKTAVHGILDRETRKVRANVIPNIKRETLQSAIINGVASGSTVFTDQAVAYDGLAKEYVHEVINHLQGYVRGRVHTNGIENFWSLLKRGLNGTYVSVEPFHLDRYVDEQVFRFNNRGNRNDKVTDADRFNLAVSLVAGHRLTYQELTGKNGLVQA